MKFIFPMLFLVLAACVQAPSPATVHPDFARIDRDVRALCAVAVPLSGLAGPYAPLIIGGCATEAGIAKLASDPESVARLHEFVEKVRH
jgi:hypothetical protein